MKFNVIFLLFLLCLFSDSYVYCQDFYLNQNDKEANYSGDLKSVSDQITFAEKSFENEGEWKVSFIPDKDVKSYGDGHVAINLKNGIKILGSTFAIKDDLLVLNDKEESLLLKSHLSSVRYVQLQKDKSLSDDKTWQQMVSGTIQEKDIIYVKTKNSIQVLPCIILKTEGDRLYVLWNEEEKSVQLQKVLGFSFANTKQENDKYLLSVQDINSNVYFCQKVFLESGVLELKTSDKKSVFIPTKYISTIKPYDLSMIFLSDMLAVDVQYKNKLLKERNYQSNQNLFNKPILCKRKVYSKGIVCQAYTKITFMVPAEMTQFFSYIGIEDSVENKFGCEFIVLKNKMEVFRKIVTSIDEMTEVNISVKENDQLDLLVDFGAGLDVADHAVWADAKFLKK